MWQTGGQTPCVHGGGRCGPLFCACLRSGVYVDRVSWADRSLPSRGHAGERHRLNAKAVGAVAELCPGGHYNSWLQNAPLAQTCHIHRWLFRSCDSEVSLLLDAMRPSEAQKARPSFVSVSTVPGSTVCVNHIVIFSKRYVPPTAGALKVSEQAEISSLDQGSSYCLACLQRQKWVLPYILLCCCVSFRFTYMGRN